jgi:hypothetical protein
LLLQYAKSGILLTVRCGFRVYKMHMVDALSPAPLRVVVAKLGPTVEAGHIWFATLASASGRWWGSVPMTASKKDVE